jgi:hypothetical protein
MVTAQDRMSAAGTATGVSAGRSRATPGLVAFVLAVAVIAVFDVALRLVTLWSPPSGIAAGGARFDWPLWLQAAGMLVAAVLGAIAVVTDRGRGYGLVALGLAVIGTDVLYLAVLTLVRRAGA